MASEGKCYGYEVKYHIEKMISNYPYHLRTANGIPIEVNVKGLTKQILDFIYNRFEGCNIKLGERYNKLFEKAEKYRDSGTTRRYAILLLKYLVP